MNDFEYILRLSGVLTESGFIYNEAGNIQIEINNDSGIGSCGLTRDAGYKSIIYYMTVDEFLKLTPQKISMEDDLEKTDYLSLMKENGIAMPFLEVDRDLIEKKLYVYGHEGRHRCVILKKLGVIDKIPVIIYGGDTPLPLDMTGWTLIGESKGYSLELNEENEEVMDNYKFKNFNYSNSIFEFFENLPNVLKTLAIKNEDLRYFIEEAWHGEICYEYKLEDILDEESLDDEAKEQIMEWFRQSFSNFM